MKDIPETRRKTVLGPQTSAASGTNQRGAFLDVDGLALSEVDELLLSLEVTQALVGTAPTMDIHLQRAIRPNPSPAVDADWDTIAAFTQVAAGQTGQRLLHLPVRHVGIGTGSSATGQVWAKDVIAAGESKYGHWGDRIRVKETMGGTVTTPAIYNIHATAVRH